MRQEIPYTTHTKNKYRTLENFHLENIIRWVCIAEIFYSQNFRRYHQIYAHGALAHQHHLCLLEIVFACSGPIRFNNTSIQRTAPFSTKKGHSHLYHASRRHYDANNEVWMAIEAKRAKKWWKCGLYLKFSPKVHAEIEKYTFQDGTASNALWCHNFSMPQIDCLSHTLAVTSTFRGKML